MTVKINNKLLLKKQKRCAIIHLCRSLTVYRYIMEVYMSAKSNNKIWNAALYLRLSKEDMDKKESASISAQREILREFLKNNPDIREFACYEDDGVSGTTFDRPGYQKMMQAIENGHVNCVIVKSYSRLARNTGLSIEMITETFVQKGVRFISIQEGYDSYKRDPALAVSDCMTIGMHSVINESVVAATSVSIRGTLNHRRKMGMFIGSSAPSDIGRTRMTIITF